jgi:hypothetical protein
VLDGKPLTPVWVANSRPYKIMSAVPGNSLELRAGTRLVDGGYWVLIDPGLAPGRHHLNIRVFDTPNRAMDSCCLVKSPAAGFHLNHRPSPTRPARTRTQGRTRPRPSATASSPLLSGTNIDGPASDCRYLGKREPPAGIEPATRRLQGRATTLIRMSPPRSGAVRVRSRQAMVAVVAVTAAVR